jgi:ABC-2 type transport system permease protein
MGTGMRLWWVEVSRLFARRFTRVALVLLVGILGLFVFTAAYGSEKPSAGSLARAEQEAAAERAATRARCEAVKGETPGGDTATDRPGAPAPSTTASPGTPPTAQPTTQPTAQPTAQPTTQPTAQPTATSEPGPSASPDGELFPGEFQGVDCATIAHPTAQDMLRSDYFSFRDDMPLRTIGVAVLLALLGYLVAASFVGAEWQHGTMAGLLLWEPRRVKVFLAKLFALFTGLAVVGVLAYAVTFGAHWLVADTLGDTAGVGPAFQRSLALTALRGIAVALVIAACGFAVAYAARLSAAALGLAIAYFIGAEIGLRLYRPESQPWLLTENVKAWLERGSTISIYDCADPSRCTERVLTLTMWQGGAYLAGLALILAVIAAVLFARRDVT